MGTAVERAYELTEYWAREAPCRPAVRRRHLRCAHTHRRRHRRHAGRPDELLSIMDGYGISQAFTFCMDEPDRHPAFSAANDRTLAWTEETGGRLVPFVRLDLAESPIEEAERCLDRGAASSSIPARRASCSRTSAWSRSSRSRPSAACPSSSTAAAGCRRSRRASPGSSTATRKRSSSSPTRGSPTWPGSHVFGSRAGVFFDTSAWSPVDLLDFYRQVSPEQVLYASDYPYGQQPSSLLIAVRTARAAGFDEQQLRDMLYGNARASHSASRRWSPRPRAARTCSRSR